MTFCWNLTSLRHGCLVGCRPLEHHTGHFAKEHQLLEKDQSACLWCGGRDFVLCLPALSFVFLWRITSGGCPRDMVTATTEKRSTAAGGAQHAAANTIVERPTGYW